MVSESQQGLMGSRLTQGWGEGSLEAMLIFWTTACRAMESKSIRTLVWGWGPQIPELGQWRTLVIEGMEDMLVLEDLWWRGLSTCLQIQGTLTMVHQGPPEPHIGREGQETGCSVSKNTNNNLPTNRLSVLLMAMVATWPGLDCYRAQLGGQPKESGEPSPSTQVSQGHSLVSFPQINIRSPTKWYHQSVTLCL